MMGYKIKNRAKLENKTPKKLVDIIIKCLNPNPKLRCDLEYIKDQFNTQDWRSNDLHANYDISPNDSAKNISWFDEMKFLMYKQMTPYIVKEEMQFKKFLESTLQTGIINQMTRIFYH